MLKLRKLVVVVTAAGLTAMQLGCSVSESGLRKTLKDHPEIIYDFFKENPEGVLRALSEASENLRAKQGEEMQKKMAQQREEEFKNPKKPEISNERAFFGAKDAPVTIVEYSDFQCPWCARAQETLDTLLKKYDGKIKIVFKNLPYKPGSELAARYFEAVAMQGNDKAKKFHDTLFKEPAKIHGGAKYLDSVVKKVGADLNKVKKDIDSKEVTARIEADMAEAQKFDINGTPGFIVNGVTLHGAQPVSEFESVIERHLSNN